MKNKVEIKDINLSFGSKHILKDINLDIPENKIVALIGPSGSGKSTLLRCLNRMHDLDAAAKVDGDVLVDGESIFTNKTDVVEVRKKIGMVFQKPNPFPKTIFENIAYGLKINGQRNRKQLKEAVESSLKESFLWEEVHDDLEKSALRLSGGQQQRLCIARTIAVRPEVILMDEPCSALDPLSTAKIEELMLELKKDYTIVIVTHNMQQAERVADYTAVLYLGGLLEYGDTRQIFESPKEDLTRKYVKGDFG